MRKFLFAVLLSLPIGAYAEHVDVIEFQLKETCSMPTYLAIVADFNEKWGKKNSYQSEILVPIQSNNLTSLFWVGRSANTAAFGKAFDQWVKDTSDPDSLASSLWTRFQECSDNVGRRSYLAY